MPYRQNENALERVAMVCGHHALETLPNSLETMRRHREELHLIVVRYFALRSVHRVRPDRRTRRGRGRSPHSSSNLPALMR
jgi:hypothetical protein